MDGTGSTGPYGGNNNKRKGRKHGPADLFSGTRIGHASLYWQWGTHDGYHSCMPQRATRAAEARNG